MSELQADQNPTPKRPKWQAEHDDEGEPLPTLDDAPVVKWLLILNIAVHVFDELLQVRVRDGWSSTTQIGLLTLIGRFNIPEGINGLQIWRLFTYQFLHGGLIHLGLNMMALYVFGPMMEQWWGKRRFLAFYLLCGACGAWLMAMMAYTPIVDGGNAWLVGASGSIFGILVGVAMAFPRVEVKLMIPPMWITVRRLALVFLLISAGSIIISWNTGGNFAHLGGALFGYLLMKRPWSLDFADKNAPKLDPPGKPKKDLPPEDTENTET